MVLRPLSVSELNEIFDDTSKKVIKYYIDKAVEFQPELKPGQKNRPIQIPKEHIEQWIVQAIECEAVGAGSYPVDIIKHGEFGADIKMLNCKVSSNGKLLNTKSGEASLAQKFKDDDETLDDLFKNHKWNKILSKWMDILSEKYKTVLHDKEVDVIYFIFLLRAGNTFYICGCELDTDKIYDLKVDKKRTTSNSVFIKKFIDSKYGEVKIYKAKKRMELRLYPSYWVDQKKVLLFESTKTVETKNMRDFIKHNF